MASPITIAGIASLRVAGETVYVKGNMTINLGTPIREPLETANGAVGFKQRAGTPSIEFEAVKVSGMSLGDFVQLVDVPITVHTQDDTVYALEHAWAEGDGALESEEGTIPIIFRALTAQEIPAS